MPHSPKRTQPTGAPPDIEEIALGRFMVRDLRATPILKGEGELRGRIFELTTWRREGLIARLRAIDLVVSSLEDQIGALPELPQAVTPGPAVWRALAGPQERYSRFGGGALRWEALDMAQQKGEAGILALAGAPLRRRKGRGPADFFLTGQARNGELILHPTDETGALLVGYAQAKINGAPQITAEPDGDDELLPPIDLPEPHRALFERIGRFENGRFAIAGGSRELAASLLARLGVRVLFL